MEATIKTTEKLLFASYTWTFVMKIQNKIFPIQAREYPGSQSPVTLLAPMPNFFLDHVQEEWFQYKNWIG